MLLLCLCTLGGAYSLSLISQLPPTGLFHGALLLAAACLSLINLRPVAFFLIGFALMGISAAAQKSSQLDPVFQGESVGFTAVIEDFPIGDEHSVRFVVRPTDRTDLPHRIRLTWYQPDSLPAIGESWRLKARLKRPRGYANPGGFDFEGWLFRERIGATGYVIGEGASYKIHGESPDLVSGIRQRLVDRVSTGLPQDGAAAVLMAIGVGARHRISREQWDLYARTGTSHLMAISGLHIGLAATFAYVFSWILFAPFCKRRNLRDLAMAGAVLAAFSYATLSGFAVPARRALLMAIVAGSFVLLRRRMRPVLLVVIPCFVVFLTDPISVLTPGFELSFAAVAILIFVAGQHIGFLQTKQRPSSTKLITGFVNLTRLQLALLTGLFPLTILLFDRFSIIAPAINMLVLPVFNFITVPLTLAGSILDGPLGTAGDGLLAWAYSSIKGILWLVELAGEMQAGSFRSRHLGAALSAISLITLVFTLLPPGWPGRKLAFIVIIAVLNHRPPAPSPACLDYSVLDVGQGLAVVLRTHKLIVSHGDLDHAGGVDAITAVVAIDEILNGEELSGVNQDQRRCIAGDTWQWDGVTFSILHPRENAPWERNNSSCVLLVEVGQFRLLLTGDIESPAEKLRVHRKTVGASDVVIVPHHGSLTSSSPAFVDATGPDMAMVSTGFQNRWRFPRPEVVARWERSGADVLNTATMGAISQRVCAGDQPEPVRLQRQTVQKFWHEVPQGRP